MQPLPRQYLLHKSRSDHHSKENQNALRPRGEPISWRAMTSYGIPSRLPRSLMSRLTFCWATGNWQKDWTCPSLNHPDPPINTQKQTWKLCFFPKLLWFFVNIPTIPNSFTRKFYPSTFSGDFSVPPEVWKRRHHTRARPAVPILPGGENFLQVGHFPWVILVG